MTVFLLKVIGYDYYATTDVLSVWSDEEKAEQAGIEILKNYANVWIDSVEVDTQAEFFVKQLKG